MLPTWPGGRPFISVDPADGLGVAAGGDHVEVGEGVRDDGAVRQLLCGGGPRGRVIDQGRAHGGGERIVIRGGSVP